MALMNINLTGTPFTDYHLVNVGAGVFQLEHDWWTKEDLVIRTAPAWGGTLLIEGTDYTLGTKSNELSARVSAAGPERQVFHQITIINSTYQSGDLYFSGKYIADSNEAGDINDLQDQLGAHAALAGSSAHGAVSAPTASQIITRDAAGRAQIVAPSVAADIVNKGTLDTHAALAGSSAHGAVSAPTASQLMTRDTAGRAQVVAPSVAADIATKGYADGLVVIPTGVIAMWGTASPPTGWLTCDGTVISETIYAALFAVIGHGFGGDPGGGNFYLPNFKGISPTGVGAQDISTRTKTGPALGVVREDTFQTHKHAGYAWKYTLTSPNYEVGGTNTNTNDLYDIVGSPTIDGTDPVRAGAYTHGPEIGINFIIKT